MKIFLDLLWVFGISLFSFAIGCLVAIKLCVPHANNVINYVYTFSGLAALCILLVHFILILALRRKNK